MSQWDFFSSVKVGATNVWDNVMLPSACRSHPLVPVHMLYCFQSICEFFVISSSCDIEQLQIGRVLISGDKSLSRHCAYNIPNVTLTRYYVFGWFDVLTGLPAHHLKHADSEVRPVVDNTVCWERYRWRYCVSIVSVSHRRSAVSLTRSFLMWFLESFYHTSISL
jgi:hypothetical protein